MSTDIGPWRIEKGWFGRWRVYLYAVASAGHPNGGKRWWFATFTHHQAALDFINAMEKQ